MSGPRWARALTDANALAGVISFVAAFWWDGVIVAVFALVLLGLTVPRVAGLPGELQAVAGVTLLVGAWAATLDWYSAVPVLDVVIHALANGLIAAVCVLVLTRLTILGPLPRMGLVIVTAGVGALLGVIWEGGEWIGHTWINDAINVGYDDTVGDLVAGALGSALAGLALAATKGGTDG